MHVHQPRSDDQPFRIDFSLARFGFKIADSSDDAVPKTYIGSPTDRAPGIDDCPTPNQNAHLGHSRLHTERRRLSVQHGPGDGVAVERLVRSCVTKPLY